MWVGTSKHDLNQVFYFKFNLLLQSNKPKICKLGVFLRMAYPSNLCCTPVPVLGAIVLSLLHCLLC